MQVQASILAADARLKPFDSKRGWQLAVLGAGITLFIVAAVLMTAFIQTSDPNIRTINLDFRIFWAAGKIALSADPLAVFDSHTLAEMHGVDKTAWMPWLYPPGYLVLMMPFGMMDFAPAMTLSILLSALAIALAVRPFVAGNLPMWIAMSLSPAYAGALFLGQNSLFWAAGLLFALAALRDGRWAVAGVCIGLLTLKPQLGVMIPFALLAAGQWRVIAVASVTAIVIAVLPTFLYGLEYWHLFAERLGLHAELAYASITKLYMMVGPLLAMIQLGVPPALAFPLQTGLLVLSALAVFLLWRSDRISFDVKVAGLLTAILFSAPYFWYYEAGLMALAALFLVRAGLIATRPLHVAFFVLLWLGGGVLTVAVILDLPYPYAYGTLYVTPLLVLSFGVCLVHLYRCHSGNQKPSQ
jgi:arabinofuranan 3-O-arabinosyltransferase